MRAWIAQVRKGLVEVCILAVLRKGETYGYQLLQELSRAEGLALTESTVYPMLSRLRNDGWITVRVAPSPTGPPRRYYRLTPLGESHLQQMETYWKQIQTSTNQLLKGETGNGPLEKNG